MKNIFNFTDMNNMLKILAILIILVSCKLTASAQEPTLSQPTPAGGWTVPNAGSYGTIQQGLIAWKSLGFPTGNGSPNGTQKYDVNVATLYMDSTNSLVYVYNPKGNIWIPLGSFDSTLIPTDSTDYLDSTGQPQYRVLFALPGKKIGSSHRYLYDSVNDRVIINNPNVSFAANADKLAVNGRIYSKAFKLDFSVLGENNYLRQDPATKIVESDTFAILKVVDETGGNSRLSNDTLYVDPIGGGGGGTTDYQTITATAGQDDFVFTDVPASEDDYFLTVNGVVWEQEEYTESGDTITLTVSLDDGDIVSIRRIK